LAGSSEVLRLSKRVNREAISLIALLLTLPLFLTMCSLPVGYLWILGIIKEPANSNTESPYYSFKCASCPAMD
jgi:hypothetical protein